MYVCVCGVHIFLQGNSCSENCLSYKCENKNHPKAIYIQTLTESTDEIRIEGKYERNSERRTGTTKREIEDIWNVYNGNIVPFQV